MITEFVRRRAESWRQWEPSHAGPLVDVGAMLLRKSQARESERDQERAKPRELTGRALIAVGTYMFMRELFGAAENVGYLRGSRIAREMAGERPNPHEVFWRGRHAGWTEAAAHWGLPLPAGVNPYREGVPDESFPTYGRVGSDGIPMSPFTHFGSGHGRYVVIGGRRFLADACECVDAPAGDVGQPFAPEPLQPRPGGGFFPRQQRRRGADETTAPEH